MINAAQSRTIHAGHASGEVVRCGVSDAMLAELPVSVVFFYDQELDPDRLAAGLAEALRQVPLFGGRLRSGPEGLEIVCSDAGVPLVTADAAETLPEAMSRMTLGSSGYVDHVEANRAQSGEAPLFTVKVSRLADGGTALGCSWHHVIGDVQSFMTLMQAWSAAVEGAELPEVGIAADREAFLDAVLPAEDSGRLGFRIPEPAEAELLAHEFRTAPRANRTVQVYFTDAEVAAMKREFGEATGQRLSSNDVLAAHVVTTVRELDEDTEARDLLLPVNVRRYLGIPAGQLGNLLGEVLLRCPVGEPAKLAGEIRSAVDGFATGHLSLRTNRDFLASVGRERLSECVPLGFDPANKTFTLSSWSRAGVYQVAFEGHRPLAFSPGASVQLPWVAWMVEGFSGAGHLLTVVLPTRLSARLRGEEGRAALHRYRDPDERLPELAVQMKKLA
ncbi:acyltransferase [Kitasatospora sp. NPDC002040]|uniref:acyltransferase n=1 Tax=Kitasatospora sp. NPDC002040 TaxID=3154661 RepID=UPI003322BAF9